MTVAGDVSLIPNFSGVHLALTFNPFAPNNLSIKRVMGNISPKSEQMGQTDKQHHCKI